MNQESWLGLSGFSPFLHVKPMPSVAIFCGHWPSFCTVLFENELRLLRSLSVCDPILHLRPDSPAALCNISMRLALFSSVMRPRSSSVVSPSPSLLSTSPRERRLRTFG